jgi:hypothetical protein
MDTETEDMAPPDIGTPSREPSGVHRIVPIMVAHNPAPNGVANMVPTCQVFSRVATLGGKQ